MQPENLWKSQEKKPENHNLNRISKKIQSSIFKKESIEKDANKNSAGAKEPLLNRQTPYKIENTAIFITALFLLILCR